jgi:predicted nucleic acid-binding protein
MTTFVDTNVIIDALDESAAGHAWAVKQLEAAEQPLVICDIVYSEFSISIEDIAKTNAAISELALDRTPFTDESLFRAGKAFFEYKKRGGTKTNVLSDFLIGALAASDGATLLTANPRDFRSYFPALRLICPS